MAAIQFLFFLLQCLLQPRGVGDELDEATQERMQQYELKMKQEMARLLMEEEISRRVNQIETKAYWLIILEQSGTGWEALLFATLQQWLFWVIAGVLLFMLYLWLRKRSSVLSSSSNKESSGRHTEKEKEEDSHGEDQGPSDGERILGKIFAKRTRWPLNGRAKRRQIVKQLVDDLLHALQVGLSNSLLPVLQPAIGVGSAFEGWSPSGDEPVYCLLVPLKPPHGYSFFLEMRNTGEMPSKECQICVDLKCICSDNKAMCIIHRPVKELRKRHEGLGLTNTLCTGPYLDVQKTALWIQGLVRSAWHTVPLSHHYRMKMLPSKNSCKMELTDASEETFIVELIFGVQQGNSDIFLCSQPPEAVVSSSTTWPMSCAVAEAKFFRQIATKAPRGSLHLKCLHACTRILAGTSFSPSILKTVVMHLLTTIPLSAWQKDFVLRLEVITQYLHSCLKEKQLNHFFFGNESVPKEIILPPEFQTAEPYNLFHHLVHDPVAHARALEEFEELKNRLAQLLFLWTIKEMHLRS